MNTTILIDATKIPQLLQQNYQFIDLRNPTDFTREHLMKFKNIPYDTFDIKTASLDKTNPIVFICYAGNKSLDLATSLNKQGYHCYSIQGGYYAVTTPINNSYY